MTQIKTCALINNKNEHKEVDTWWYISEVRAYYSSQ